MTALKTAVFTLKMEVPFIRNTRDYIQGRFDKSESPLKITRERIGSRIKLSAATFHTAITTNLIYFIESEIELLSVKSNARTQTLL